MCPTSVSMPVDVTRNDPAPRVTWVFMKAMSTRSPSAASAATASTCLGTGRLSPVSADSSISRVAAVRSRPSAGTRSPASMLTMSPGTSCSIGNIVEGAVAARLRLDHHHLLERGDARRRLALLVEAHRGVEQGQGDEDDAGRDLVRDEEAEDAGREQDDLHRVLVLAQERLPAGLLGGFGELVRPVLGPARLGLGVRQPSLGGDALALQGGVGGERVPDGVGTSPRGRLFGHRSILHDAIRSPLPHHRDRRSPRHSVTIPATPWRGQPPGRSLPRAAC